MCILVYLHWMNAWVRSKVQFFFHLIDGGDKARVINTMLVCRMGYIVCTPMPEQSLCNGSRFVL